MNSDCLLGQAHAFWREFKPQYSSVLLVATTDKQAALFHLWQKHREVRTSDQQFVGQILLGNARCAEQIDQNIEMRWLDVERLERARQRQSHHLTGPTDGDPIVKSRIVPRRGLLFVHGCTILFIVELIWDFTMASLVEKVTRAALKLIAAQSPEKAGEVAFWLFTRTRSVKPQGEKERLAIAKAKARMAQSETVRLVIPGSVIATHVFRPAPEKCGGERVLIVHGYRSRSDHMVAMADALVASGHTAVCLDLPGHGASTGRVLHLGKAVEAIDAAWRQHGPFDTFVGHSFGGPSVMAAAAGAILHVPQRLPGKIVTIAAPSSMADVFRWVGNMLGLGPAAQSAFERHVLRFSGRPLSEFRVDHMLEDVRLPMLVIHAEDDKEVAFSNAEAIACLGPHVSLMKANGFGHRRIVSAPQVTQAVAEFASGEGGGGKIAHMPLPSSDEIDKLRANQDGRPRRLA